jgi:hypothetical protein
MACHMMHHCFVKNIMSALPLGVCVWGGGQRCKRLCQAVSSAGCERHNLPHAGTFTKSGLRQPEEHCLLCLLHLAACCRTVSVTVCLLRPPPPLQDKVGEPVYLAGNSLGGYLGVNLAARHPEAIKGLVLLNATPFWSQRPPVGQDTLLWQVLNVDAALPVTHVSRGGGIAA